MVLLFSQDRKQFVTRLQPGLELQTHRGVLRHDDLIGLPWGSQVLSHTGYPFLLLEPSTDDLVRHIRRSTQIIYPKDASYILLKMAIRPGRRVIEAGTGSGGLTLTLAQAVMPTGRVYSYEVRPEMQQLAIRNLSRLGLDAYVEFKLRDIAEGFDERDVDALFLDLRTPWDYLEQATEALAGGGFFGCLVPTANQVIRLLQALESGRYPLGMVEVEELLLRPYKAVAERFRPQDRIVGHTGYLIFARKVVPLAGGGAGEPPSNEE